MAGCWSVLGLPSPALLLPRHQLCTCRARHCAQPARRRSGRTRCWPAACTTTPPTRTVTPAARSWPSSCTTTAGTWVSTTARHRPLGLLARRLPAQRRRRVGRLTLPAPYRSRPLAPARRAGRPVPERRLLAGARLRVDQRPAEPPQRAALAELDQPRRHAATRRCGWSRSGPGWCGTCHRPDRVRARGSAVVDGIGMFNHPGDKGALNWDDYGLNAAPPSGWR